MNQEIDALHATKRATNATVTPIADITVVITHFVSVGFFSFGLSAIYILPLSVILAAITS